MEERERQAWLSEQPIYRKPKQPVIAKTPAWEICECGANLTLQEPHQEHCQYKDDD